MQIRVAEVAKAFYHGTYELAVLLARALTRRSWSSPIFGGRGPEALPRIACTLSNIEMYSTGMGGCLQ
jgi:hypothetical protein